MDVHSIQGGDVEIVVQFGERDQEDCLPIRIDGAHAGLLYPEYNRGADCIEWHAAGEYRQFAYLDGLQGIASLANAKAAVIAKVAEVHGIALHRADDPEPEADADTWANRIKDLALEMEAADPRLLRQAHLLGALADRVEFHEERMRQEDR